MTLRAEHILTTDVDLDYRTELRTLNEHNFAPFDAKIDVFRAETREEVKLTIGAAKAQLLLWMFNPTIGEDSP
jgi:hypothetical protein